MRWLRRLILRFIDKIWGRAYRTAKYTGISNLDYDLVIKLLEPGDILLTRTKWNPTNLFIPGFWKHAAMYTLFDTVTEALAGGVEDTPLLTLMMRSDYVMIVRPAKASENDSKVASIVMRSLIGRPYDLKFEQDNDAFYCSEAIAYAYIEAMGSRFKFIKRRIMGIDTILPNDFTAHKHFIIAFDSRV